MCVMVWCDVRVCVGEGATLRMLLGTSGGGWQDAAFNPGSGVGVLSSSGHLDSSLMELSVRAESSDPSIKGNEHQYTAFPI